MDHDVRHNTVTVYHYWIPDPQMPDGIVSSCKAPLETLRDVLGCEPLLGTGHEVARDELDSRGLWQRRPTGWGALDD